MIMSFNSDLNKQALEVTFSRTMTKSYHSQICFNNLLGIYLNEKFSFYYHILARNVQISVSFRKAVSFLFIRPENLAY